MAKAVYYKDLANYHRFPTREIFMRNFNLGANNHIRLQSMTNTDTQDIEATVKQAQEIIEQGADYLRITTPTIKDVKALDEIRHRLRVVYETPLIADIHFSPKVAYEALSVAEKIRINPGNFVDRTRNVQYNDKLYKEELQKIEEQFRPILLKAKKYNRAIRIGTNIGSLSERILQKYGATAEGLVQATLEYIDIARKYDFHNIVVSIKASSPRLNVWANRLLISRFMELGYDYPIHLGVTEAGNGIEGRIKSAVGIGALLLDGIGDTVRVSLAEHPKNEIPVARLIVNYVLERQKGTKFPELTKLFFEPYSYKPRKLRTQLNFEKPVVVVAVKEYEEFEIKPDYVYVESRDLMEKYKDKGYLVVGKFDDADFKLVDKEEFLDGRDKRVFLSLRLSDLDDKKLIKKLKKSDEVVVLMEVSDLNVVGEVRWFIYKLVDSGVDLPVIFRKVYDDVDKEVFGIKSAVDSGMFLIDGLINGIFIENEKFSAGEVLEIATDIVQASGSRYYKAEIVACPSCGRATFDVEKMTNWVKSRLGHLSGVKIAVMGCIVNGLGEMTDADYAYVGMSPGSVALFDHGKMVAKNLSEEEGIEMLEKIILEKQNKIIDSNLSEIQ